MFAQLDNQFSVARLVVLAKQLNFTETLADVPR